MLTDFQTTLWTPRGSLIVGVEHVGTDTPDAAAYLMDYALPVLEDAVDDALRAGKQVVFLAEGKVGGYKGSEQETIALRLAKEFGTGVRQDTWDDEAVEIFEYDDGEGKNRFKPEGPAGKQLIEHFRNKGLVEAGVYSMLVGQGDEMTLSAEAEKVLRSHGVNAEDRDALYRASFPQDFDAPINPLSEVQEAFNRLRQSNMVNKIRNIEADGGVALVAPGASHVAALKPMLEGEPAGQVVATSDQGWDRVRMASRVVAKYKSKKKIKTKDGEERTIYEYSDRQIAKRNAEKAKKVEKLKTGISKLRSKIKRDLSSDDPDKKLTALAVALIDHTYERVGNDESAEERGHFGVTGWQRGHLSFGKGGVTISYTGKSGVKHKKKVTDDKIKKALRDAYEAVEGDEASIFEWDGGRITAEKVNAYLEPFDITAKDLRGFHANRLMAEKLRKARKKGGALKGDKKAQKKKLKDEFKAALEETAEEVGHEAATLKNQYLVVGLEDQYLKDGSILDKVAGEALTDLAAQVVTRFLLGA